MIKLLTVLKKNLFFILNLLGFSSNNTYKRKDIETNKIVDLQQPTIKKTDYMNKGFFPTKKNFQKYLVFFLVDILIYIINLVGFKFSSGLDKKEHSYIIFLVLLCNFWIFFIKFLVFENLFYVIFFPLAQILCILVLFFICDMRKNKKILNTEYIFLILLFIIFSFLHSGCFFLKNKTKSVFLIFFICCFSIVFFNFSCFFSLELFKKISDPQTQTLISSTGTENETFSRQIFKKIKFTLVIILCSFVFLSGFFFVLYFSYLKEDYSKEKKTYIGLIIMNTVFLIVCITGAVLILFKTETL